MLKAICFSLFLACAAFGQQNGGYAYYGIMHPGWPCEESYRAFDGLPAIRLSVLWETFGEDTRCLQRLIDDERPKVLEIHLINEVCQRNKRCGDYEPLRGISVDEYRAGLRSETSDLAAMVRRRGQDAQAFLARNSDKKITCYISGGLESNLDGRAGAVLISSIQSLFPGCTFVWNPVGSNQTRLAGTVTELHGASPKLSPPCISNLDGQDISFPGRPGLTTETISSSNVPAYLERYKKCEAAFLWVAEFNGNSRGAFVDPRRRGNWPTRDLFQKLRRFLLPSQVAAARELPTAWTEEDDASKAGCRTFPKINDGERKGFLFKSSDGHPGVVALLPAGKRAAKVELYKAGRRVQSFSYSGLYTEDKSKRQIWRAESLRQTELPFNVVLKADGQCYVMPNPRKRID